MVQILTISEILIITKHDFNFAAPDGRFGINIIISNSETKIIEILSFKDVAMKI